MRTLILMILAPSLSYVTGCGGKAETSAPTDTDTDTDTDADADTDTDTDTDTDADADTDTDTDTDTDPDVCATSTWADQDNATRGQWMEDCVVPGMMATFQAQDPVRFADFGCETCHRTASVGNFDMPSVAPLDWYDTASWEPGYYVGDGSGFMEVVLVQMAGILDQEPFDPTTNTGDFSCNSCHLL
jgi:hypothetical protein